MDPRPLVAHLETLYSEYSGDVPVKEILIAGLGWETQYWPSLAVAWVKQGAAIDNEVRDALDDVAGRSYFPQPLRHKAFALARKWEREHT
jgi:hypothetical protein